jgi:glycosyltransferase involved in cell wall biosynthesis
MLEMANGLYDLPMILYPLLFPHRKFYIETSTPSVAKSKLKRFIIDSLLGLTLKPYKKIGCGNPSTVKKLRIPEKKVCYSKIGFPEYTFSLKQFDELHLVYLGTVNNRDIWKTVIGLKNFILKFPEIKITYDIIGGGNKEYVAELTKSITENNIQNFVRYHGFQPGDIVNDIFTKCNIGIAFVPIVEYYDDVSTTKALEYLLSGMPIIATKTTFATGILKPEAGVLCNDSPEDFAWALEEVYKNRRIYDSEKIRSLYKKYAMSYIVKNSYIPMLKSLYQVCTQSFKN